MTVATDLDGRMGSISFLVFACSAIHFIPFIAALSILTEGPQAPPTGRG